MLCEQLLWCEFNAWAEDWAKGGEETAFFLQSRDKCSTDDVSLRVLQGARESLHRIHEVELECGVR